MGWRESHAKRLISRARHAAGRKSVAFDLTYQWILETSSLQDDKCAACGFRLNWSKRGTAAFTSPLDVPSLDRIAAGEDYVEGNVRITCRFCNMGRNASPADAWDRYCSAVFEGVPRRRKKTPDGPAGWIRRIVTNYPELSAEWAERKLESTRYLCPVTKVPLVPISTPYYPFKPSVDRVDNAKPHVPDNCRIVSLGANLSRGTLLEDAYATWLRERIASRNAPQDGCAEPPPVKRSRRPFA